ncbi:MAG: hypothetical protein ACSLE0_02455 [Chitinophagaceae bacterium]
MKKLKSQNAFLLKDNYATGYSMDPGCHNINVTPKQFVNGQLI